MDPVEFTRDFIPQVVIAGFDETGKETFLKEPKFLSQVFGNLGGRVLLWEIDGPASIPANVGGFPSSLAFPAAGGVKFALVWVAPESVGDNDFTKDEFKGVKDFKIADDPRLHVTDSFDFAVVLQGEAELILPDNQVTIVRKGSIIMQAGIQHAWRVTSEEPLVLVFTLIGATRP